MSVIMNNVRSAVKYGQLCDEDTDKKATIIPITYTRS